MWGGWLLVTAVVFSLMSGIVHPYYAVALAPAIAAVAAIAGVELWRGRAYAPARCALAAVVAVTGVWTFILLDRYPDWLPFLRWVVVVLTVAVATALVVGVRAKALGVAAVVTALLGSAAFTVATAAESHTGSIPLSGPVTDGMDMTGPPMSEELADLLAATTTKWAGAVTGATLAADLELASGKSVIAIGGWSGDDPAPTLAEFQQHVANGEISYYIGTDGTRMGSTTDIADWVSENYTSTEIDDQTVYDLRG
jgi:4-amino-4-deoxy-L-arabinose transferase-like glycosyltransferase